MPKYAAMPVIATAPPGAVRHRPRARPRRALGACRVVGSSLVVTLLVVSGAWASWGTVQYSLYAKEVTRGTMTVDRCGPRSCTGPFVPRSPLGEAHPSVELEQRAGRVEGDRVAVALRPETAQVVRTGLAGFLYGWLPLAGALLLASVIVAGGLRLPRPGLAVAATGVALITATFLTAAT